MANKIKSVNHELVQKLLEGNMESYHFRIIKGTAVVLVLIILVTGILKFMGLATPAINYRIITVALLEGGAILAVLWMLMKRFGDRPWAKWVALTGIYACLFLLRTVPYDAPESHAVFYLVIVMSLFYFDPLLILAFTLASIAGDFILLKMFPELWPKEPTTPAMLIRYLSYIWVSIAGAIGSQATRELIEAATELKSSNIRLKEDIERKEKIDLVRKEFIASASHELKSPISLIEGYANLLRDRIAEEERDHAIDIIIDESHRMSLLVSDLLDISQMDAGALRLRPEAFYVHDLMELLLNKHANTVKTKSLLIKTNDYSPDLQVIADPYRIEMVLNNLLSNALRYTPEGGRIEIRVKEERDSVTVEIDNQGPPIRSEDLTRVWDPFYRSEKSRNRQTGGTGLGLAISKRILQLHNSQFGAYNSSDGVCFYFSLPSVHCSKLNPVSQTGSKPK